MHALRRKYNEFLDKYPKINICGYNMKCSEALKLFKPIQYEISFQNWLEELESEEAEKRYQAAFNK